MTISKEDALLVLSQTEEYYQEQGFKEASVEIAEVADYIESVNKELEFEKAFNGHLCSAVAQKRKVFEVLDKSSADFGKWIPCRERLPRVGEDVILYFRDTYHTDPSWPETQFLPAWRCNVAEEDTPNGQWAIEGRLWNTVVIDIEDGIAWMPMPKFEE